MSTREEAFSGNNLDVAHFKIFGSSVYFHVTKDSQKNLESTTDLGIFVVYTDTNKNYQVYMPSHGMKVVKRYVKFNEDKAM